MSGMQLALAGLYSKSEWSYALSLAPVFWSAGVHAAVSDARANTVADPSNSNLVIIPPIICAQLGGQTAGLGSYLRTTLPVQKL
jgi:hypothetical protein